MARVIVVGAGPAGLVAARRLGEAGHTVTVFEEQSTVGGRLQTREVDGFTMDRGFQVLFAGYPGLQAELDVDALDLHRFSPGAVLCRDRSRVILADPVRAPSTLLEGIGTREITLGDKLRTVSLRRHLGGSTADEVFDTPDQTALAWLEEVGFSSRFIGRFARPLFGGITLDRSLTSSANALRYAFAMMATNAIVVPEAGMAAVPRQLADRSRAAGVTIETDRTVRDARSDGTVVLADRETRQGDAVVVATDPPTARSLTGVEAIPTDGVGCTTQYYAFEGTPLAAGRRIMLNAEGASPNHLVQHSAVVPSVAPVGTTLLSATFLDGLSKTDDELAEQTRTALTRWYPERSLDLRVVSTDRIPFAQFAQPPGIHRDLPTADTPEGSIYLAGEYTQWSSIEGAIRSGQEAASSVRAALEE